MRLFLVLLMAMAFVAMGATTPMAADTRLLIQGDVSWTKTTVTLTGSSQTLSAASRTRKGIIVLNRAGNGDVTIDLSGGDATQGLPVSAGAYLMITGQMGPYNAITIKGTNTQIVDVWIGQ